MTTDHSIQPRNPSEVLAFKDPNSDSVESKRRLMYFEPMEDSGTNPESSSLVADTLHLLRWNWWRLMLSIIAGAGLGASLTLLQEPTYLARTTMEIHAPVETVFGMQGGPSSGYAPEAFLQTQVKLIESRTLKKKVLAAMKEQNLFPASADNKSIIPWRKYLGLPSPKVEVNPVPRAPVHSMKVHTFENTQLIEIQVESPNSSFSADLANTIAKEFIHLSAESRWSGYQNTSKWMERQLNDIKTKLENSERELQTYSVLSEIQAGDEKDSVYNVKLKQIQEELSKAQGDRVAKQAIYEIASGTLADAIPQVIDNERLSAYQSKLTELRREAAEVSSLYTPEHYRVIRVKAQIAEMESTFKRERDAILMRIRNEFQSAQRRELLLDSAYKVQSQLVSAKASKAIHYEVLKREVETDRQLYRVMLQKVKEANVASALTATNINVIDPAEAPSQPYKPNIYSNMLKGLGAGLLIGIFLVVSGDRINRSLRAPGETPYHLKVPELGVIPSASSLASRASGAPPRAKHTSILLPESETKMDERLELITWQDSSSLMSESFRNALTSILLSSKGVPPKVLLVTSASRGEGKSMTVSNLGLGLAEINQRILLIDADMRKPRLHTIFGLSNSWGLSDLLREKTSLADCPVEALVRPTELANMRVLPSGPGALSISSLLYSERMSQLLARLRREFDTIIIDTPPMLTISDARILGRLADGAILVVRAGSTTRDAALQAKERLTEDGIPVLGTILNSWDLKSKAHYGAEGYHYHAQS